MSRDKINVCVVCTLDGYANSSKPDYIKSELQKRGFNVVLLNTIHYGRAGSTKLSQFVPNLSTNGLIIFFCELIMHLIRSKYSFAKHTLYYFTEFQMNARARVLKRKIENFDFVIFESMIDSYGILKFDGFGKTIYDCATPFADEMYFGDELTESQYVKFKNKELRVYNKADHLSFHWSCYGDYVKKYYNYKGNTFTFDYGVVAKKIKARYSAKPRIVYLGYLGGYWINTSLLAKLSKMYDIDVFGSPKPDVSLNLNYKGYANTNVLADYQFGLITITKDRLRSEGFSAKHIEYLSYGLPVLMPEWRTSTTDMKGTISYNEANFERIIKKYSNKKVWTDAAKSAQAESKKYSREKMILPLIDILRNQ
jgi:hypothetical protein